MCVTKGSFCFGWKRCQLQHHVSVWFSVRTLVFFPISFSHFYLRCPLGKTLHSRITFSFSYFLPFPAEAAMSKAEVSWGDGQGNLHVNLEPDVGHRLPWDLHHWRCAIVPRVSTRNNRLLRLDQWHQIGSDLQHPLPHLRLRLLLQRKDAWCDIISSNEKFSSLFSPLFPAVLQVYSSYHALSVCTW